MDKDNQAHVVDLFHQYRGRLAKLGATLSTSKNLFKVDMEGTHTRYLDNLDRVISFHEGLQASLDMEAGKREQLIELIMGEKEKDKVEDPLSVQSKQAAAVSRQILDAAKQQLFMQEFNRPPWDSFPANTITVNTSKKSPF